MTVAVATPARRSIIYGLADAIAAFLAGIGHGHRVVIRDADRDRHVRPLGLEKAIVDHFGLGFFAVDHHRAAQPRDRQAAQQPADERPRRALCGLSGLGVLAGPASTCLVICEKEFQ